MMLEVRATTSFFLKSLWRATVLVAVIEHVICQSDQCAGSMSCVRPVPTKEHEGKSLESLWLEIRCYLGCVDQVRKSASMKSLREVKEMSYCEKVYAFNQF